jgi:hypothetical protein
MIRRWVGVHRGLHPLSAALGDAMADTAALDVVCLELGGTFRAARAQPAAACWRRDGKRR